MRTARKQLFGLTALVLFCLQASATPVKFWWTGDRTQNGQMTMFNPSAEDGDTGVPVYSADIDNDGYMDALLSAMTGDGRLNNKPSCGELHVLFGVDSIKGLVDFANYNNTYENLCTIWGRNTRDYFGSKSSAGDLDGDGIKDLIVGADWSDTPGRVNSGEVFIFWGGSQLRNSFWDLADSNDVATLQVTMIRGAEADDKLGVWFDAGDVNGDSINDLLIGAPRGNGFANNSAHDQTGEAYLIYGPFSRADTIDLANPGRPMTVIFGIDSADQMGNTVELGDINGDGFEDIILSASAQSVARLGDTDQDYPFETGGAGDGPFNNRPACGEVYILPGGSSLPDTINLAAGMPVGSTIIYGAHGIETAGEVSGDCFGEEINCANINGDGIIDVLFGAFRADGLNNDIFWAGNNYIFYGRHNWPPYIDLANGLPDSTTGIYGGGIDWLTGDSTPLGDINGDGFFDIIGGCVHGSGTYDIYKSGTIRILFGKAELLPPVIDFANQPDTLYAPLIQGSEVSDLMSYWGTTGDFNHDGYWDVITNVMHGDGPNNERHNAGDFYIISGEWITNHPGQPRFLNATSDSFRVVLGWHDNQERGEDWHIIFRSTDGGQNYDSVGSVPFPVHTYIDSAVTAGETYTYRLVAVGVNSERSNPSYPLSVLVGATVSDGLPLVVNGIHWGYYGNEADNFYDDHVLLGGAPYDFWDLYSTTSYPDNIVPIGHGIDSLAQHLFEHPTVLWISNGFDPDTSYNDGNMLYNFGPQLVSYMQAGGKLLIVGKEMNSYLSPDLQLAFSHTVNWGFQVTVTTNDFLTPFFPGVGPIHKRTGAPNIANLAPFSVDNSGCSLLLHSFADNGQVNYEADDHTWMSELSRGSIYDPYNFCLMSMRPYRANETDMRNFMQTLLDDLFDHYPAPTGMEAEASGPNEIMVCWDAPIYSNVSGHTVIRKRNDGAGTTDTLGFVPAGTNQYFDMPPDPFAAYDYWVFSEHTNGMRSLDSWHVTGFSPPSIADGTMLIINGLDWATYGQEATNLYANHVLQGGRDFRFWDLFTAATYPAGYVPIGNGIAGLTTAIWEAGTTLWVFNGFNGDEIAFNQLQPMLDTYISYGGGLMVVGKELDANLDPPLRDRLGATAWTTGSDWTNSDLALGEHPALMSFGKITTVTMNLIPEFTLDEMNPNVVPVYRRSGSIGKYLGAFARADANSPYNFGVLSLRPYRADPVPFAQGMDVLLESFLGSSLSEPVNDLTIIVEGDMANRIIKLNWSAVANAIGYRVCRRQSLNDPLRFESVIGTPTVNSFVDPFPIENGPVFYNVVPQFSGAANRAANLERLRENVKATIQNVTAKKSSESKSPHRGTAENRDVVK